mmetsp:Transcript_99227/g.281025  ORF Transcript_99227/g.281025 Transcript_99227/m.281025 type:complete len:262 (+) Transcript_99227:466-1251(+)
MRAFTIMVFGEPPGASETLSGFPSKSLTWAGATPAASAKSMAKIILMSLICLSDTCAMSMLDTCVTNAATCCGLGLRLWKSDRVIGGSVTTSFVVVGRASSVVVDFLSDVLVRVAFPVTVVVSSTVVADAVSVVVVLPSSVVLVLDLPSSTPGKPTLLASPFWSNFEPDVVATMVVVVGMVEAPVVVVVLLAKKSGNRRACSNSMDSRCLSSLRSKPLKAYSASVTSSGGLNFLVPRTNSAKSACPSLSSSMCAKTSAMFE